MRNHEPRALRRSAIILLFILYIYNYYIIINAASNKPGLAASASHTASFI